MGHLHATHLSRVRSRLSPPDCSLMVIAQGYHPIDSGPWLNVLRFCMQGRLQPLRETPPTICPREKEREIGTNGEIGQGKGLLILFGANSKAKTFPPDVLGVSNRQPCRSIIAYEVSELQRTLGKYLASLFPNLEHWSMDNQR